MLRIELVEVMAERGKSVKKTVAGILVRDTGALALVVAAEVGMF